MAKDNILVLVGGGHASGKSTAAYSIKTDLQLLPEYSPAMLEIEVLNMEKYMNQDVATTQSLAANFAATVGHKLQLSLKPSRFDFRLLKAYLSSRLTPLDQGLEAPQRLIIVHGLYALYDKDICDMSLFKVYIDSDADTRLVRWIRRDVLRLDGGQKLSLESVINQYLNGAKQEMADYIFQTKERADVVMPRGSEANGIALIVDGLLSYLGSDPVLLERKPINTLRPFANERLDGEKRKFYELS